MEPATKHIIQKLVIDLEINASKEGASTSTVQQRISEIVQQEILPCIDRCLANQPVPEGVTWRFDNLYMDLGELRHFSGLTASLATQIETVFSKQLAIRETQETPLLPHHRSDGHTPINEAGKTTDAFIFFLKTGKLPWWASSKPVTAWEREILQALEQASPQAPMPSTTLLEALCVPTARKRLLQQFSRGFVQKILLLIAPESKAQHSVFQKEMAVLFRILKLPLAEEQALQFSAWETMCQNIVEGRPVSWADANFIKAWLAETAALSGQDIFQKINQAFLEQEKKAPFVVAIAQTVQQFISEELPVRKAPGQPVNMGRQGWIPHTEFSGEAPDHSDVVGKPGVTPNTEPSGDAVYIANAGLVLIAPFLPVFFERLGLMKADRLTNAGRAACLLQYLTTGQRTFAEYDLFLNKILCNIEPGHPLVTSHKITRQEQKEARQLLLSVIGYWSALKDSSPEGLQLNFMQRNGMVQPYENGWKLTVEQQTFDILLDELPWTISYIQLPWMEHPLWVDWT